MVPTNGSHHHHNNHHSEDLPVPPPPAKKDQTPLPGTPKKEYKTERTTPVSKETLQEKGKAIPAATAAPDVIPGFGDKVKDTGNSPNIDAILRLVESKF